MDTMRKFMASLSGLATAVAASLLLSACGDGKKPMPTASEPVHVSAAAKTAAQPAAPTNFRAATVKTQAITLTWDAVAGATGYKVQKRRASSKSWENAKCQENDANKIVSGTTCTAEGLKPATEFRFRVRSWNDATPGLVYASEWVELSSPVSTYARLSAPTAVSGSSTAAEEITVTWTAAAGEADRVVGYRVQRQQAGKSFWKLAGCTESSGEPLVTSGTTCTVSGLKTGVQYRFQVKAHGDAGHDQTHSAWSQPSALITADIISFADANLERVVRDSLGGLQGPLTVADVAALTFLEANFHNIQSLAGLEYCTALQALYLDGNQISDVSALASLTNLQALYLTENQISDVSGLASLTNLTGLYLGRDQRDLFNRPPPLVGNQISDVSALASLTNLQVLYLDGNQISDVSGLVTLTKLTHLDLTENQISDVSGLASLTNLTGLDLDGNQISDVSALASLTNLIHLDLGGNQISDVSALASLTNLQVLDLDGNQISDVSALASLTNLIELDLDGNQISDVSGLASLTNLIDLDLDGNQISDVSALVSLTNLQSLYLGGNQPTDVSALASLTNLKVLALQDNQLTDVSALTSLTKLQALDLQDNQISDVSALASLTNLTGLLLKDNQISDVSALTSLTNLQFLLLEDNPLNDQSLTVHIPAIQANGTIVLY